MTQSKAKTMINQRKIRLMKYLSLSVLLLCLSWVIVVVDPLERLIEDQLTMRKGSFLYRMWQKPPLPVLMHVYMFNITNADAFLSGLDKKLKLEEIGPYVYQEVLENKNATFHENGTLSFVPDRYSIFVPERSVGDPHKDIIVTANLPLLGLSTAAAKYSTFAAFAASALAQSTNSKPLLNLTVQDFLWGYKDNLISLANTVVPNYINFDRFGLMDRLFDEGHNEVFINLPKAIENLKKKKDLELKSLEDHPIASAYISKRVLDVEYESSESDYDDEFNGLAPMAQQDEIKNKTYEIRDYSIESWNGSPGLKHWGFDDNNPDRNSPCSTLRGAYDGTLFPRSIKMNEKFKFYRKAFCRTLPIQFTHSGKQYGYDAYWFKLSDNAFDDSLDDPETMCYCNGEKTCMKRGLGNITPCYYNIPTSVSLPHFYNSDPSLVNEVEGIKPVKEKHESLIIMQPRVGVPIKVHSRIQLNLMNGETKFNSDVKKFDHLTLPVFWLEIAIEDLTPGIHVLLCLALKILPVVQIIIVCLLALVGLSCLATSFLNLFCFSFPSEQSNNGIKFTSKKSIKYTAVFPYIKREMAKFEERERELIQRSGADNV